LSHLRRSPARSPRRFDNCRHWLQHSQLRLDRGSCSQYRRVRCSLVGAFVSDRSLRDVWIEVEQEWTWRGVCIYIEGELALFENTGEPAQYQVNGHVCAAAPNPWASSSWATLLGSAGLLASACGRQLSGDSQRDRSARPGITDPQHPRAALIAKQAPATLKRCETTDHCAEYRRLTTAHTLSVC